MTDEGQPKRPIAQTLAARTAEIEYTAEEARTRLTEDGVDVDGFLGRLRARVKEERDKDRLRPLLAARARIEARRDRRRPAQQMYLSWDAPQLEAELRRREAEGRHATGHHNYEKLTIEDMRTLLVDQDELDADDE